jgi:Mn2+/Fe2+ NRAMP family transporter
MTDTGPSSSRQKTELVRGLPMFAPADVKAVARERDCLRQLQRKNVFARYWGYFTLTGPGWLQSALTLGSGSAIASIFAGVTCQYSLLWVQPIAMVLGIIMLDAIAYQTLTTRARPFMAIKLFLHPAIAWLWASGALIVTLIWHFPQYALAAGMTEEIVKATTGWGPAGVGRTLMLLAFGLVILMGSTWITWSYGKGHRGVRLYERILKVMVWMVVITFLAVVLRRARDGAIDFEKVATGMVPLNIPADKRGFAIVMAAFSAVVGINSTFLFPYTLLARGWGREHRGLSRFDLITGTLLPFCLVTSLIVIAAGSTIYDPDVLDPVRLTPVQAARIFEAAGLSAWLSRVVFGLGIVGMSLSTLTVHMLMSGFAACELLGIEPGGWRYRLACLFPVPGFAGVILWKYMGPWIAIPASAMCGLLLPFAYLIFITLHNKKSYLGSDTPVGMKALLWNSLMILTLLISVASAGYYLYSNLLQ